jgi:menaquinone-dependent protoporphyrinogen IX oxidase
MQMKNVLIAYATNAGSTTKVAQVIGEELSKDSAQVQVRRLEEVTSVEQYDAVVVGAPMIMGWHGAAVKFVKKHQRALSHVQVAYFLTAMNLTQTNEMSVDATPIYVDPRLAKPPKNEKRLSFKERYATASNYLRPVLDAAPSVKPVSVGFLGGKLELYRLPLLQMLFVLLVIQAQPGDFRNWPVIREWAANSRPELLGSQPAQVEKEP